MGDFGIIVVLFGVGALLLVSEIFLPSHGILTVGGLGFLAAAIYKTFAYGETAGVIAIALTAVAVPTLGVVAVKNWYRTPFGKRLAPPNPVLTAADTSVPIEEFKPLIGTVGKSVSPLRPVGICEFNGRRVPCVVEVGMLDSGTAVEAVGIRGAQLLVAEKTNV